MRRLTIKAQVDGNLVERSLIWEDGTRQDAIDRLSNELAAQRGGTVEIEEIIIKETL